LLDKRLAETHCIVNSASSVAVNLLIERDSFIFATLLSTAMAPERQTAVKVVGKDGQLTDKAEDNVIVVHDAPVPKPGEGEVLTRVKYRCFAFSYQWDAADRKRHRTGDYTLPHRQIMAIHTICMSDKGR
jgi:hypothetical protein